MPKHAPSQVTVESTFDNFVRNIGGELVRNLIPNRNPCSNADYMFGSASVVAELKCLENETFTAEYERKMQRLADSWTHRRLLVMHGKRQINLRTLPLQCQAEWLRILEAPIQKHVVAAANKQIRATKERLGLPNAKGLLLIASDGNCSLQPYDFMCLLGRVLKKRDEHGAPQYSSIHGIAYFSVTMKVQVPAVEPSASFWIGGARASSDIQLQTFIDTLEEQFYAHICNLYRCPIRRITLEAKALEPCS
jgi:hypothetical protein